MKNELSAGKIVNTHGIRGEVKATFSADDAGFFHTVKTVHLMPEDKTLRLLSSRPHKGAVLLKFEGVEDMTAAEALIGQEIYVPRSETHLPEGRYFIADILDMTVVTEEGEALGRVTDVFPTGSNDVFEVTSPEEKTYYIPHIRDVVRSIDTEKRIVTIHVMEGLLDDED